ncbi:phage tail protein [Riemerella anatipestifer]|uniref:phage tail spike protein n=1 Tax=Riemerella anatipestifer TaxID=34085 RepID=UPI001BDA2469|nr:phage tail spike protein [Riemerella anatipestifer]MBT0534085.1 phage tail protein [Riemerella anatipestifer]MBT0540074.1 phage tail protein [Riemerella anatipestifer]MBT0543935.1 phage tail protein [Riemerella anatipestifer]MBT0545902.1 phage tail protein [Riemerella anatipestifer]MBT0547838.1 phage tail protein [Riemerella anatipestifer]
MEFIVIQGDKPLNLNNRKPLRSVTKAEHRQSLLSEDVINITVESKTPLALQVGNHIEYENRKYTLNSAPKVKKEQGYYAYDLVFEGVQYLLRDKVYFNLDAQGFQNTTDFPLTGKINIFLTTLITNINSISDFTWVLGEYPQNTETKTLTFNNENCLAVLQKICQEYDTEFEIKQDLERKSYTLNIKKIGETLNQTFEYGKGNGLYSLSRENANDNVVTRLYVFGSTNNIKSGYRDYSQRLRLPISHGKDYIQDDAKVKLFGLKEGVKNFDDIKPTFKGIVSGVTNLENGSQEIEVSNMDFDLNETDSNGTKYLLNDTPAKLHINKGNLAGYEFELLKNGGYNHATKTFRVKQFTDERGQKFPEAGSVFSFAVGDEVTLLDIALPEQYITNAENKLLEEGQKEYEKQSVNNLKYNLELDPLYLQQIGANTSIFFKIGDCIRVVDEPLKIDKTTRIVDITRDLLDEYNYKIGIADTYEISFVASLLTDIKDTKTVIKTQEQINRQNYLNGYRNLQELRENVFDVEGYFDPTRIKPESIETNMLSVGAKSQQFALENISLNPNIEGNPARTFISGGKLVHFSLEDDIREWNLLPYSRNDLLNQVYYVYAKCSRGNGMGVWHITTEQIRFDSRSDYYYFLCYLLYTPKNGKREAEAMYGNVFMHGGQITAGRIKSLNGQTYFDLDSGEIAGTIKFKSGNGYVEVGSAIQQAVDAVSVGGRNLVRESNIFLNGISADGIGSNITSEGYLRVISSISNNNWHTNWFSRIDEIEEQMTEGEAFTITFWVKRLSGYGKPTIYLKDGMGYFYLKGELNNSEFKPLSYIGTWKKAKSLRPHLGWASANGEFIIKCWKIEKGNKATDWTPNPQDIEQEIIAVKSKVNQIANLGTMAWQNSVEKAMLGNTIVQGGYIKTELLNASAIVSNGGGATSAELNNAINSIIIGGRNLMLTPRIYNGYAVEASTSTPLIEGKEYVISFDIKGQNDGGLFLNNSIKVNIPINPSPNEWFRVSKVFTFIKNDYQGKEIYPHIYGATDVRNVKLEKGNKATDWTPAPEDLDTLFANLQQGISNMQTSLSDVKNKTDNFASIQGGLMMANLMSVGSNQANQNAFISGITDEGAMSVRFGAGSNYANKNNAPFRVLDNGKVYGSDMEITGGKIARFNISGNTLSGQGIADPNDYLEIKSSGSILSYKKSLSSGRESYALINNDDSILNGNKNNILRLWGRDVNNYTPYNALSIRADGQYATALNIESGDIRVGGEVGYTGELFLGGVWLTIRKGIITNYS